MTILEQKVWDETIEKLCEHYCPDAIQQNKGVQFEVVVEQLLKVFFLKNGLKFTGTKLTHDGSKDFWGIDNFQKLWWVECKNYADNISLTHLAPTLIMAELHDSSYLLFFSHSILNLPLKKKIGQYAVKNNKKIQIYEGEMLEYLIAELWNSLGDTKKITIHQPEEKLEFYTYNEKNIKLTNKNYYTGYSDFDVIQMGEIYNLNILLINRSFLNSATVHISLEEQTDNQYFQIYSFDDSYKKEIEVTLAPYELSHIHFIVRPVAFKEKLEFPSVIVQWGYNREHHTEHTESKKFECTRRNKVIYQGVQYDNLRKKYLQVASANNFFSSFLLYGPSGGGKTRAIEEAIAIFLQGGYLVYDFTNIDRNADWRDVIRELTYALFEIPNDLALDIIISDLIKTEDVGAQESVIVDFLRLLMKKETTQDQLEPYYKIIFEKLHSKKFVIAIDNIQDFEPEIIGFLDLMINHFLVTQRRVRGALFLALNTSKVYHKEFLKFLSDFLSKKDDLKYAFDLPPLNCEHIHGFETELEAMAFLTALLNVQALPIYDSALKQLLRSAAFRPKIIQMIAENMRVHGFDNLSAQINEYDSIIKAIRQVPSDYTDIFRQNFQFILEKYKLDEEKTKCNLAVLNLFSQITPLICSSLELDPYVFLILERHGVLQNLGNNNQFCFEFDHDLIIQCIETKIYPDLHKISAEWIRAHEQVFEVELRAYKEILLLCCLEDKRLSFDMFCEIESKIQLENVPARLLQNTCINLLSQIIHHRSFLGRVKLIQKCKQLCIYVRDHISEKDALKLFEQAKPYILECPPASQVEWQQFFSFVIHYCETRNHVGEPPLQEYRNLLEQLSYARQNMPEVSREFYYAEAYVNNRIFVLGKLFGEPDRYMDEWKHANTLAKRFEFYDILFENYFDRVNVYLYANIQPQKAKFYLRKGFKYYRKYEKRNSAKFRVNYNSKRLQYLLLQGKYIEMISFADKSIKQLENNVNINYHLFFLYKYLRYKIFALMLSTPVDTDMLHSCFNRYQQLSFANEQNNQFELSFLTAKCAFHLGDKTTFLRYWHDCCDKMRFSEEVIKNEVPIMMDLAYKYRQLEHNPSDEEASNYLPQRAKEAKFICTCPWKDLQSYVHKNKLEAPFSDDLGWDVYFI